MLKVMTSTAAFVPPFRSPVDASPSEAALARAEPAPRRAVYLGTLGSRSVATLVDGDSRDLLAEHRGFAEALADPATGDRTRLADVARGLAVARAQQGILDVILAEALRRKDLRAAEAVGKQLDRLAKRIDSLLAQHRAELAPKRPVVVVRAENANVLAVGRVTR